MIFQSHKMALSNTICTTASLLLSGKISITISYLFFIVHTSSNSMKGSTEMHNGGDKRVVIL